MSESSRDLADPALKPASADTQLSTDATDIRDLLQRSPAMDPAQLIEAMQLDQVRRWRQGQRVPAEAYLQLCPRLVASPESAFDLVYGEYVLRKELGETPSVDEYRWRFPQYAEQMDRQLALDAGLSQERRSDLGATLDPRSCHPDSDTDLPEGSAEHPAPVYRSPHLALPGYEILEEVGRGGMGVVYKARQQALGRVVALKIIRAGVGAGSTELSRFLNEARAAARLQHPHIVQVYDVGSHLGQPYIALEFVAGGNLADRLAGQPLPPRPAAHLLAILAETMHAAHQQGIVHRDLKPANILLHKNESGNTKKEGSESSVILPPFSFTPKVADFGLAKQLPGHVEVQSDDKTLTHSGMVLGTPQFMAPEQAAGRTREVGPLSDVYSLGAILYVTLTGRAPYVGAEMDVLLQVMEGDPLPPGRLNVGVPRELETICLKCLARDPRRRYASAHDLADDLRRYLRGEPIAARPAGVGERVWKWAKRRPAVATLLTVSGLALVVFLLGGVYTNRQLRSLVQTARNAEQRADANAQAADTQRRLALDALQKLVFEVQTQLQDTPATRAMRERLLDTAVKGLRQIAESTESSAPEIGQAAAHEQLARLFGQVGRRPDAQRQFELAKEMSTTVLAAEPQNDQARLVLCRADCGLGELEMERDDIPAAREHFRSAAEFAETWHAAEPADSMARLVLANCYDRLALTQLWVRDVQGARTTLDKALPLVEAWVANAPDDLSAKDSLDIAYERMAVLLGQMGDHKGEREYQRKALAVSRALAAAQPANLNYKRGLMASLQNLGAQTNEQGEISEALELIRQAADLGRHLVAADPDGLQPQLDLIDALTNLGLLARKLERQTEALTYYREALDRIERLQRAGKLEDRPMYSQERKSDLQHAISFCSSADAVLKDGVVAKGQHPIVAADLLVYRLRTLLRQARLADASATADLLCKVDAKDVGSLLHLAEGCALSGQALADAQSKTPTHASLQPTVAHCADRAVEALRQAVAAGLKDPRRLESDPDLSSLRQRQDFQELLQGLKKPR